VHADPASDAVGGLQDQLTPVVGSLESAAQALAESDRSAAAAALADAESASAVLAAAAADPSAAGALAAAAKKARKAAASLSAAAVRAHATALNDKKSVAAVLKSVKAASLKAGGFAGVFLKVPTLGPVVILEEVNAKSAGFHKPGEVVTFRAHVYPVGSCAGPASVDLVDAAAVHGKTSVLGAGTFGVTPGSLFTVTMGPDAGAARVVLTACGRTSVRLLNNYGGKPAAGGGKQTWSFVLTGTDTFTLCGYPQPQFGEDYTAVVAYDGDLVQTLQHSGHDDDGTGTWGGSETAAVQQPNPPTCTLVPSSPGGVSVTFEAWWSSTTPSLHIRALADLIPHRYVTTFNGAENSIPVRSLWLDVTTIGATTISGTWHTVGSGSADGNASAGTWTGTRQ
jgi:hypothetical protein